MDSIQSLSEASRKALNLELMLLDIQHRTLKYWNWGSERGGPIPPRDQSLYYGSQAQGRIGSLGRTKASEPEEEAENENPDNDKPESDES